MDGEADATGISEMPGPLVKRPSNIMTAIAAGIFATDVHERAERCHTLDTFTTSQDTKSLSAT